ncbi:MAG TPA: hypothetical protein VN661_08440 [Candidatus Acidoferrales bacterium]|nr:hypothetical protein [Candidatus Acidoferrales bacterium]
MPSLAIAGRIAMIAVSCALPLALCGCPERATNAAAPAPTPAVQPSNETIMNVAPDTTALPPAKPAAKPPQVPVAAGTAPVLNLPAEKPEPPRPRRPAEAAAKPDDEPAVRPQPPQIFPQLSPTELADLKRSTNNDLVTAERNLSQANGRRLDAEQQDLVDKIRSAVKESRQASSGGDWRSASNLAKKALLQSRDLIKLL